MSNLPPSSIHHRRPNDFTYRRFQPSMLFVRAPIPHVIRGQDAVQFSFGAPIMFYEKLDLVILLPPSKIQEAVKLLALLSYSTMTCADIDEDRKNAASKKKARLRYTPAFRDRPGRFARLKLLHDVIQIPLPLCPKLPFSPVSASV